MQWVGRTIELKLQLPPPLPLDFQAIGVMNALCFSFPHFAALERFFGRGPVYRDSARKAFAPLVGLRPAVSEVISVFMCDW